MAKLEVPQPIDRIRPRFDEVYDTYIVGGGFFETDEYYKNEKERYWRSLELLSRIQLPAPARVLEIGGGQMAVLRKVLFGDQCTVGDISRDFVSPLQKAEIEHVIVNLMDPDTGTKLNDQFDLVVLLEVIEHIPLPGHVVIERIKPLLKPGGVLFLTTPNLFRLRNLVRMALGVEFLDRFTLPQPGQGLGHQLEYSADHLQWQINRAGMEVVMLEHDNLGARGHSTKARLARKLLSPLDIRPKWRNSLAVAARRTQSAETTALR